MHVVTGVGLILVGFLLLIFGVIVAVGSHLSLQEIAEQRAALGGLGGVAINFSDFLGASNYSELESNLETLSWVSAAGAIVGLVIEGLGFAGLSNPSDSSGGEPSIELTPRRDEQELGVRRGSGTHSWKARGSDGTTHAITVQASKGRAVIAVDGIVLGHLTYSGRSGEKTLDLNISGEPAYLDTRWGRSWITHQLYVNDQLIQ